MNLFKINTIAYKTTCILFAAFLFLGGLAVFSDGFHTKGLVGLVVSVIMIVAAFQPASIKLWAIIISLLLLAMFLVGILPK